MHREVCKGNTHSEAPIQFAKLPKASEASEDLASLAKSSEIFVRASETSLGPISHSLHLFHSFLTFLFHFRSPFHLVILLSDIPIFRICEACTIYFLPCHIPSQTLRSTPPYILMISYCPFAVLFAFISLYFDLLRPLPMLTALPDFDRFSGL